MHSAHVAPICQEVFDDDAVLVIDGGNTAIWANLYHEVRRPHTLLSTWKFGMLGAGPRPGPRAHRLAFPDRQVYCITGDGAMGFHPQEIETAVRNDLPVVFVVLERPAVGHGEGEPGVRHRRRSAPRPTASSRPKRTSTPISARSAGTSSPRAWERTASGSPIPTSCGPRSSAARAAGRCAVVHVDVDPKAHKFAPNLLTFKEMHAEPAG